MADWIDASRVGTWAVLASIIVFVVYYATTSRWWKHPLGWGIIVRDSFFACLIGLIAVANLWSIDPLARLEADTLLLYGSFIGINVSTIAFIVIRHKKHTVKIVPRGRS